ncbi:MAG TPA: hypothetical protein VK827_06875 [Lysobacter sp.]|nr:hypothetical protein [Lysobacter sp.]
MKLAARRELLPLLLFRKPIKSFRLTASSFLLMSPKETEPRKGLSPTHLPLQVGFCAEFPTRHPWLGRKPAGIHARRPSGPCTCPAVRGSGIKIKINGNGNGTGNGNGNGSRYAKPRQSRSRSRNSDQVNGGRAIN